MQAFAERFCETSWVTVSLSRRTVTLRNFADRVLHSVLQLQIDAGYTRNKQGRTQSKFRSCLPDLKRPDVNWKPWSWLHKTRSVKDTYFLAYCASLRQKNSEWAATQGQARPKKVHTHTHARTERGPLYRAEPKWAKCLYLTKWISPNLDGPPSIYETVISKITKITRLSVHRLFHCTFHLMLSDIFSTLVHCPQYFSTCAFTVCRNHLLRSWTVWRRILLRPHRRAPFTVYMNCVYVRAQSI